MDKRNVVLDGSNEEASERLSQIIKELEALASKEDTRDDEARKDWQEKMNS